MPSLSRASPKIIMCSCSFLPRLLEHGQDGHGSTADAGSEQQVLKLGLTSPSPRPNLADQVDERPMPKALSRGAQARPPQDGAEVLEEGPRGHEASRSPGRWAGAGTRNRCSRSITGGDLWSRSEDDRAYQRPHEDEQATLGHERGSLRLRWKPAEQRTTVRGGQVTRLQRWDTREVGARGLSEPRGWSTQSKPARISQPQHPCQGWSLTRSMLPQPAQGSGILLSPSVPSCLLLLSASSILRAMRGRTAALMQNSPLKLKQES